MPSLVPSWHLPSAPPLPPTQGGQWFVHKQSRKGRELRPLWALDQVVSFPLPPHCCPLTGFNGTSLDQTPQQERTGQPCPQTPASEGLVPDRHHTDRDTGSSLHTGCLGTDLCQVSSFPMASGQSGLPGWNSQSGGSRCGSGPQLYSQHLKWGEMG